MKFLEIEKNFLSKVNNLTKDELNKIIEFILPILDESMMKDIPDNMQESKKRKSLKKDNLVHLAFNILKKDDIRKSFFVRMVSNEVSQFVYGTLIWFDNKQTLEYLEQVDENIVQNILKIKEDKDHEKSILGLIEYKESYSFYSYKKDYITLSENMVEVLKYLYVLPNTYYLNSVEELEKTQYTYSNEDKIFEFISSFDDMLNSGLIHFSANQDKPLAKSITTVKNSIGLEEFFDFKSANTLSTDMLIRAFASYREDKSLKGNELESLKDFIKLEFSDENDFFITKLFTAHLKKVRFDPYYTSQKSLFQLLELIINQFPKDEYIQFSNISDYVRFRKYEAHLDSKRTTSNYYLTTLYEYNGHKFDEQMYIGSYNEYIILFLEPVLKGMFFYLASLGLVEIKYDNPESLCTVTQKGKEYISVFDSLKYIKLTDLGNYIFGKTKSYTSKQIIKNTNNQIKLDEYKPIITINKNDSISKAKIEQYADKLDETRYILSYNKIFKDCNTTKALSAKVSNFKSQISSDLPKIFQEYFDNILKRASMIKKEHKSVILKLDDNKELLALFMQDERLKSMIIKAEGYRIIVNLNDMNKIKKIVRDNGFFFDID
jgi:hypothetical protein